MSGGLILGTVLRAFTPLTGSLVPATSVRVGKDKKDAPLNNLLVKRISWLRSPILARQTRRHVRERMQVTVKAKTHEDRVTILKAVVDAVDLTRPDNMGTITNIAIVSAGGGPDFEDDEATVFMGSHDFYVDYDEQA